MSVFNTLMADSGSNRPKTTTPAAQPATTSTKNNNGFFSKLSSAVNNWANKLVGNNPNAGKSGLDNPYNFVRPGREGDIAVTAGGGVPVSTSNRGAVSSSASNIPGGAPLVANINNTVNNLKAGLPATNTNTIYPPSISSTPTNRSTTPNNSGTLGNNVGTPNRGSSATITGLQQATPNSPIGTEVPNSIQDAMANIKGVNTEQGSSGTAESPETTAKANDRADAEKQAKKEQDAAAGLKALLSRWFYNPNAGKSGLDNPYNFVRPGREGDIGVTVGGGSPESITYARSREPSYTGGGIGPVYSSTGVTPSENSGGSFWATSPAATAAYVRANPDFDPNFYANKTYQDSDGTIHFLDIEQNNGGDPFALIQNDVQRKATKEAAAQQQRIDDFVNGSFAGDWNAFNRALQQAGIEDPQKVGNYTLSRIANDYFNKAGTYSPFGGGQAEDTAYFYEPGYGSLPLQTTNGATTNIDGTSSFTTMPGSFQGDPATYGYGSLDNSVPLQGTGFGSAESVLNGLITAGYPSDTAAQLASILGLETPAAAEEETSESGGGGNGGGGRGGRGGRGGGNSGTYNGGGNVATNNTTGEVNDYLYTLPEVSNSVSGALLNRLLPSGYDYNYNARMQSRLGDLQAAEDYYRNSAIPTLQNVYQNQAANTLANYLQAIRANRQSGLTSGANRGAQLASEVQAMQSANKENSENLNNTVGTNLANMLSTLTGKRATAGTDTAGELQPYTTSMDNALSQVLMYYLYGNAAAEVNNGGLRRQNTVNYTAV